MKRCVDGPGSYGVESNTFFRVFHRQALNDGIQTSFRDHGKGSWYTGNRIVGKCCANTDDAAAALLCLRLFDCKLRDVNKAGKVNRNQRVKVVCRVFREWLY